MPLTVAQRLHMTHRCWRLRFRSEAPAIRYLRRADLAGCTVLDIGAHRGVFSIYLSRAAGPAGRLVAFEAQPELGAHLRAVKESFGLGNMAIVSKGLSSQDGTLVLRRQRPGSSMASFHHWADAKLGEISVPVTRLDDYDGQHDIGPVRFIKCNVGGHEFDVFAGARQLLARDRPTLLFECQEFEAHRGELFRLLTELGYDGYFFYVSRADYNSVLKRHRCQLVPADQQAAYPYPHPGVHHRSYLFVPSGTAP